tara:strand:+ start:2090 stop:2263 length:174 start_codon:yes stop_codon:yes gene_type:complete
MSISKLDDKIDDAFEEFFNTLDKHMFGLVHTPTPLKANDDVNVEQENDEPKELDFNI